MDAVIGAGSIHMVASLHPSSVHISDVHACFLVLIKKLLFLSPRLACILIPISSSKVDGSSYLEH